MKCIQIWEWLIDFDRDTQSAGVVATTAEGGVVIDHSMPDWPIFENKKEDDPAPGYYAGVAPKQQRNAQHFFCATLEYDSIAIVLEGLQETGVNVVKNHMPTSLKKWWSLQFSLSTQTTGLYTRYTAIQMSAMQFSSCSTTPFIENKQDTWRSCTQPYN